MGNDSTQRGDRGARRTAQWAEQRNLTEAQRTAQERARMVPRTSGPRETGMLRAFTRYVCFVQNNPNATPPAIEGQNPATVMLTIKYRRAYLYYVANKFEEASTLFRDIASTPATTPDPENLRDLPPTSTSTPST